MTITKQDLIDMWLDGRPMDALGSLIDRIEALESKTTRFKKPTLQEVQAYMDERDCNLYLTEGENFIDYFTTVDWKVGKGLKPMKDWKAAVRTWLKNNSSKPATKNDRERVRDGMRNITDTSW